MLTHRARRPLPNGEASQLTGLVLAFAHETGISSEVDTCHSAFGGTAIESNAFHRARRQVDANGEPLWQLALEARPPLAIGEIRRDALARDVGVAGRQSDHVPLEILHIEFLGFTIRHIERADTIPRREGGDRGNRKDGAEQKCRRASHGGFLPCYSFAARHCADLIDTMCLSRSRSAMELQSNN